MTYALIALGALVAFVVVAANLMATVALIRTAELTQFQKVAQGIIVWVLPFVGAFLVLHLIGQSDREAIPEWIPDTALTGTCSRCSASKARWLGARRSMLWSARSSIRYQST